MVWGNRTTDVQQAAQLDESAANVLFVVWHFVHRMKPALSFIGEILPDVKQHWIKGILWDRQWKPTLHQDFTTKDTDLFTEMHFYSKKISKLPSFSAIQAMIASKTKNDEFIILFSYLLIIFYTSSVVFWHVIFWKYSLRYNNLFKCEDEKIA